MGSIAEENRVNNNKEETDGDKFPRITCTILALFAFFFFFQPSGPFLVLFFVEEKNLTAEQV
jgi:hypothetical protein